MRRLVVAFAILIAAVVPSTAADTFRLIGPGGDACPIVLGERATPDERTAAHELAAYLERITGVRFRVEDERAGATSDEAIWVGPTAVARRFGLSPERLESEAWRLLRVPEGLIVTGGRPRGTLYAAYHLLEDRLGVRWWTPFDEAVPHDPAPELGAVDLGGRPRFRVRDMNALAGPLEYRARRRLNGEFSGLGPELGDAERYGPPYFAHTYSWLVPAAEFGVTHPEYFALIDGARRPGSGQLCTTSRELRALLLERLRAGIARGRAEADAAGRLPPTLYDLSPDDRDGYCSCDPCRALVERAGGESGPLIDLVAELASEIARADPQIRLSTLAYHRTARPPRSYELPSNVVIRFSDLQRRDFLRPLSDPRHRAPLGWLDDWLAHAFAVRVWTYGVTFGSGRGLPFANLPALWSDFRLYADRGVEGVFVQFDHPQLSDMRDLKGWVIPRLLEDPSLDLAQLVVEFTDGYYGAAGPAIRRALELVERAGLSSSRGIRYPARRSHFDFLDERTIRRVQRQFDRAERAVGDDPRGLERVRRARMSIDRATLSRWGAFADERRSWAWSGPREEPTVIARRLRDTWTRRIEQRVPESERPAARRVMDRELDPWNERRRHVAAGGVTRR